MNEKEEINTITLMKGGIRSLAGEGFRSGRVALMG